MADLNLADIEQQYANTVCFYKGKPHKVRAVGAKIKLLDLITQKNKLVDFSLKDFSGPRTRLGFVNCDEGVVYVSRLPIRIMLVGINTSNCRVEAPEDQMAPFDLGHITKKVQAMECPEFANMLLGHYPSLKKAFEQAKAFEGTFAFDKQFAVDGAGHVYFRTQQVGNYSSKTGEISFFKNKEHLQLLIGNAYEKAARTFG